MFIIEGPNLDQNLIPCLKLIIAEVLRILAYDRAAIGEPAKNAAMILIGNSPDAAGANRMPAVCILIWVRSHFTH